LLLLSSFLLHDPPPTAIYPLSLHALFRSENEIIAARRTWQGRLAEGGLAGVTWPKEYGGQGLGPIEQVICNQEIGRARVPGILRSEEHTSELQSQSNLVCRLLLEKKKTEI